MTSHLEGFLSVSYFARVYIVNKTPTDQARRCLPGKAPPKKVTGGEERWLEKLA